MRTRTLVAAIALAAAATIVAGASALSLGSKQAEATPPPYERVDRTPAPNEKPVRHFQTTVDGQPWGLLSFTNTRGQFCAGETVPNDGGDGGQGLSCRDPETLFADHALVYFVGARQLGADAAHWANVWVWGFASPAIERLELRLTDCSVVPLRIDEQRLFFHVFGRGEIVGRAVGPQELIAYNHSGAVLDREETPLSAPTGPRAKAAGATAPRRGDCG
jgi:hypothetical protein